MPPPVELSAITGMHCPFAMIGQESRASGTRYGGRRDVSPKAESLPRSVFRCGTGDGHPSAP